MGKRYRYRTYREFKKQVIESSAAGILVGGEVYASLISERDFIPDNFEPAFALDEVKNGQVGIAFDGIVFMCDCFCYPTQKLIPHNEFELLSFSDVEGVKRKLSEGRTRPG